MENDAISVEMANFFLELTEKYSVGEINEALEELRESNINLIVKEIKK